MPFWKNASPPLQLILTNRKPLRSSPNAISPPGGPRPYSTGATKVKAHEKAKSVHLLPAYDEYTVSYKDRSDILHLRYQKPPGLNLLKPIVVIDGQFAGTWKRTLFKDTVKVDIDPYTDLKASVRQAAARYAHFIGKELV